MEFTVVFLLLLHFFLFTSPTTASSSFPEEARPTKSGYLPVDASANSSSPAAALFFAFYEAQQPLTPLPQTPLLIWLQGGPGCSSMVGNLLELGPFVISPNSSTLLRPNPNSWNRRFGVLFIDNPIGTGFSFAPSPTIIPHNQSGVADHLIFALRHFLSSDPSFASRPLFFTGESYAGKYVPALGYYVLKQNAELPSDRRINLHGVAIGNGLTHPITQVTTHADGAYFSGLIDEQQKADLEVLQAAVINLTPFFLAHSHAVDSPKILISFATKKSQS
ncbi:hypothetical protein Cni_G04383 [Canna indica]|uniref:Carboxypeptidase n=1 Tax=Canna indica TaxID=4628 RepID=A0AAQ3JTA5_9LILI|nr:hypothetical protein Cni_G04383 [Canna indica]